MAENAETELLLLRALADATRNRRQAAAEGDCAQQKHWEHMALKAYDAFLAQ